MSIQLQSRITSLEAEVRALKEQLQKPEAMAALVEGMKRLDGELRAMKARMGKQKEEK